MKRTGNHILLTVTLMQCAGSEQIHQLAATVGFQGVVVLYEIEIIKIQRTVLVTQ